MSRERGLRAIAVVDLGFGDAGKGLLTDFLTRRIGATVNVRFNGGAQAGHNVVTADGRHHTFAQFGAGTFTPGVRTYVSRHVVVHPTALVREARVLETKGVPAALSRVAVSERALVVTPFHQAANRLRELARGSARHGSCGVGVGETVHAAILYPEEAVRAADLRDRRMLSGKIVRVRDRLRAELNGVPFPDSVDANHERAIFDSPSVMATWIEQCEPVAECVAPDRTLSEWLSCAEAVVFEGAQGLLLDESLGFHPHTTWSRCTAENARELLAESAPRTDLRVCGVLRAHSFRHGPGPLPTEDDSLQDLVVEHNACNSWQGRVRRGWFDAVLARHALALTSELDALVLTHVDALPRRARWSMCDAYELGDRADHDLVRTRDVRTRELPVEMHPSLERQTRLGQLLARCRPHLEPIPAHEAGYLECIEARLARKVDIVTRGPTPADVDVRTEACFDP